MESIIAFFDSIGLDFWQFLLASAVLLLGTLFIGTLARLIFGKNSTLSHSISGAVGILFLFSLTVVIHSIGVEYQSLIAPLPYITLTESQLVFFCFEGADYTVVCQEALSMIILAFLANLASSWFPKGKNIFTWVLMRALTIILAMFMHLGVSYLFTAILPAGILTYAPAILLGILLLMLLTGALKFLVGLVLTSVSPVVAAFYTFFFASLVGKQLTRAVLTTGILTGLVYLLNSCGIFTVSIAAAALMAYIPFVILLALLWYTLDRVF